MAGSTKPRTTAIRDRFGLWLFVFELLHGRQIILRVDQRIVTKIPLAELWDESGTPAGERIRNLDQNTLLELVRFGSVQFVVADCGLKLNWIPTEKRFEFWKTVRPQIADPTKPIFLGQF